MNGVKMQKMNLDTSDEEWVRVKSRTTCRYKVHDQNSYIHEAMHVILDLCAIVTTRAAAAEAEKNTKADFNWGVIESLVGQTSPTK